MPELTDFLLDRIAEDEALAKQVDNPITSDITPLTLTAGVGHSHEGPVVALALGPVRLLAECEAKRAIVALDLGFDEGLARVIQLLANVYADHPDFDETWRVE